MIKRSMTIYINEADNGFTVNGYINQNESESNFVGTAQSGNFGNQNQIQFSLIAKSVAEAVDLAEQKLTQFEKL